LNTLVNFESAQPSQSDQFSVGVNRLTHCFAQTVTIETRLLLPANPPSMKSNINSAVEYKNLELIGGIVVTSPSLHTQ